MTPQPPRTHFELFDLPLAYAVDMGALESRYRDLQRALHPDRFARASDQERRVAMQEATRVNEAYRVLRDPLARARYLLELEGHRFDDERSTTRDPRFLMEQMELREALAEVRGDADPLGRVAALIEQIEQRLAGLTQALEAPLAQSRIEEAAELVMRMQFFRRLEEEARGLEADLEDELDAP